MFSAALVTSLLLAVPHGWHELRMSPTLKAGCDPLTLLVVGSRPPVLGPGGWRRPGRGQVLVFIEEDHVNKPVGPLKRPRHFRLPWSHLDSLEGCCGTPGGPGYIVWFRQRGHFLGYLVFAGPGTTAATRRATERMLDSLRFKT